MTAQLVVITGAGAGIGKALAHAFSSAGHPCLLISRNQKEDPTLANQPVLYRRLDVSDAQALRDAIATAESQYGPTGCLINNAGMIHIGGLDSLSIEQINEEVDTMIKGVTNGIHLVLPGMRERKCGTIINISSIGDRKPAPGAPVYHACKHAVRSLGESLNMSEAHHNVRIINLAPGLIRTAIHQKMGISFEEYCEMLGNPTFIAPAELATIVLFCWQQPQHICIRDIAVMPTDCAF
ncbi:putative oxidoreductase [Synechococcus sp. MIT S9509]|uniref:SDR family oxidoreductase n=1 Tax=unclassified Synechococcus TaxID=2626047 RepID=UPI0007BB5D13|nr:MULTISPECIES: SDR family oxidoreductase [unclassified Synechococcus]KZR87675.1 putative oxidoreductase [Synechococcus sp. MIT S9504]KZR93183.1 putative oxidoreductase [Synechococcus sp. MIT S9509]